MSDHRPIRKALRHNFPRLTDAQAKRAKSAHFEDGVPIIQLQRRFGVSEAAIKEALARAPQTKQEKTWS
jgi:hypothetical protein